MQEINNVQKNDLYHFGIMTGDENGNLRLNDNVTRAEAAKMICVAGSISLEIEEGEERFSDVDEKHWAYKYIYAAKRAGIVKGDENKNFNPENSITNEEIVKMIICLIGYDVAAEMQGGYPAGYTEWATGLGITANMQFNVNSPAIRNDVGVMLWNALDVPIMKMAEDEDAVYIIADGSGGTEYETLRTGVDSQASPYPNTKTLPYFI